MANALRPQTPVQVIYHDLFEEAQWKLSALLPPTGYERFRTLVVVGKAVEEIVRVAQEQRVDLIAMGGCNRTGLTGFLRRGLAEQVARRAPAPAMTVWNSGHAISDRLWVNDSMLWGWPDEHRTGTQASERKSQARPTRVPLGV
jgi:hypothetical protein